jgi:hypothetical protein
MSVNRLSMLGTVISARAEVPNSNVAEDSSALGHTDHVYWYIVTNV